MMSSENLITVTKGMSLTNGRRICGATDELRPLRRELQAAHHEMDATGNYFAYAVCRGHDGEMWEVTIREGSVYSALDERHFHHAEAWEAGNAWLAEQLCRQPDVDELAFRQLWAERIKSSVEPPG